MKHRIPPLLALLALAVLPACVTTPALPRRPAAVNHVVLFHLADPADRAELIADCDAMAAAIPGVVAYFCGEHLETGRATVSGDYDVGFYVGFETEAAYGGYVDHEAHIALVTRWTPRMERFVVYDVLDDRPR